ncbi:peptide/nickel transport system ATP-binding protein/oligopeptide transport system ATP-binding protein [Melghiribacillus thermohalophilus]|uniref:Peptide/nickel transport system ATP-binding protein/oligopeptide transport system ATP-binding protein n=1 Tax=Melghiribacillus thermohalophilus TaxID=1324956 RepID=A0A4R3N736_9BACI|nr:ABC transporter ATP-binding protein [Melghiribacillus thermohalophilus]TCT25100.1 peptide/nickel transport system ATP-binding protein/oligopeptide transport system ATP-binding protein [Melghiribacillus thermohalophilus]
MANQDKKNRQVTGTSLLEVRNLKTHFFTKAGVVKAVDGVTFDIKPGETLGIVGESGSGKSMTAMSIMRLIPSPPGKIVGGEIEFEGKNLLSMSEKELKKIRGNEISMIFQDPMTSLNPVFTIKKQMVETILTHQDMTKKEAIDRAVELLDLVGIPDARARLNNYPHEFSGGMRQRVMIAMALSCDPKLLIADEPTTALDVTIQAQILDLLNRLQEEMGMSIMMITHDLGVVAEVCDRVMVMYAGQPVEFTEAATLFDHPKHPYTWGLLNSIPKITKKKEGQKRLEAIPGLPPDLRNLEAGCHFAPRCKHAMDSCYSKNPSYEPCEPDHFVRCLLYEEKEEVLSND